jgi:hypothetical protein
VETELIEHIFAYHPPSEAQARVYEAINGSFASIAHYLNSVLPEGPGKTVAIRKLAEARMQANAAVALEGRF